VVFELLLIDSNTETQNMVRFMQLDWPRRLAGGVLWYPCI